MIDWYLALTPLLALAILSLLRFVGCDGVFGLSQSSPADLSVTWNGAVRDRVGPGKLALAPDGAKDGTLTASLGLSGGRTVTAVQLTSFAPGNPAPVGVWDNDPTTLHFALGVSTTLDGALLNDPGSGAVDFFVPDGGSFVVFASDLNNMEFLSGNTLSLTVTFSDLSSSSAQVVIP